MKYQRSFICRYCGHENSSFLKHCSVCLARLHYPVEFKINSGPIIFKADRKIRNVVLIIVFILFFCFFKNCLFN